MEKKEVIIRKPTVKSIKIFVLILTVLLSFMITLYEKQYYTNKLTEFVDSFFENNNSSTLNLERTNFEIEKCAIKDSFEISPGGWSYVHNGKKITVPETKDYKLFIDKTNVHYDKPNSSPWYPTKKEYDERKYKDDISYNEMKRETIVKHYQDVNRYNAIANTSYAYKISPPYGVSELWRVDEFCFSLSKFQIVCKFLVPKPGKLKTTYEARDHYLNLLHSGEYEYVNNLLRFNTGIFGHIPNFKPLVEFKGNKFYRRSEKCDSRFSWTLSYTDAVAEDENCYVFFNYNKNSAYSTWSYRINWIAFGGYWILYSVILLLFFYSIYKILNYFATHKIIVE